MAYYSNGLRLINVSLWDTVVKHSGFAFNFSPACIELLINKNNPACVEINGLIKKMELY